MSIDEICSLLKCESVGGEIFVRGNKTFFSLSKIKCISMIVMEKRFVEELCIIPYRLRENKIMELYEYILSIRVVEKLQGKEKYFLSESGMNRVEEISPEFLRLMDNTYYEVQIDDAESFVNCLEQYFDFMEKIEREVLGKEISVKDENELKARIIYQLL